MAQPVAGWLVQGPIAKVAKGSKVAPTTIPAPANRRLCVALKTFMFSYYATLEEQFSVSVRY